MSYFLLPEPSNNCPLLFVLVEFSKLNSVHFLLQHRLPLFATHLCVDVHKQAMDAQCWLHHVHFGRKSRPKPWRPGGVLPPPGVPRQQALLRLAKRAAEGHPLSLEEMESTSFATDFKSLRVNSSLQQLSLDKASLVWNGPTETLPVISLLLADLVYAPVKQRQTIPLATHVVVLAPRPKGEEHREVWLLCVVAKAGQLQGLLGRLARRGCLRWDLPEPFSKKSCQGQGGQGAVFSGVNLGPLEPPRMLQESPDMICLEGAHNFNDIAAKVWNKDNEESIRKEVSFMQQAGGHPNISVMLGLFCAESPGGQLRWALIMELCPGGDVHQHANGCGLRPHTATEVLFGVLSALIHLHSLRIIHRDVKAENVMINCDHAVLVDFGIAAFLHDPVAMKACVGSPGYAAPEVIQGRPYNEAVDIFSSGVLLYFMLYGKLPFDGSNSKDIMHKTVHSDVIYPEKEVSISRKLLFLLQQMLEKKPRKRPSARECFQQLCDLSSADSLESGAFKISLAGLVELGHMEKPADGSLDDVLAKQGQSEKAAPLAVSEGKQKTSSISKTQQVDLAQMPAAALGGITTRISQCLMRSVRHVPQFFRNVSGRVASSMSAMSPMAPASQTSVSLESVESVIAEAVQHAKTDGAAVAFEEQPAQPHSKFLEAPAVHRAQSHQEVQKVARFHLQPPIKMAEAQRMHNQMSEQQQEAPKHAEAKSPIKVDFSESEDEAPPMVQPRSKTTVEEAVLEAPPVQPRSKSSQAECLPIMKSKTEVQSPNSQESVRHVITEPGRRAHAATAGYLEDSTRSAEVAPARRGKAKASEVVYDMELHSIVGSDAVQRELTSRPKAPAPNMVTKMRSIPEFLFNRRSREASEIKQAFEAPAHSASASASGSHESEAHEA
eukprot:s1171_g1.t1